MPGSPASRFQATAMLTALAAFTSRDSKAMSATSRRRLYGAQKNVPASPAHGVRSLFYFTSDFQNTVTILMNFVKCVLRT